MEYINISLIMTIFLIIIFESIIYGALNTEMFINGEGHIRVDRDIRITNLRVIEQENGAYETYNSNYSKNSTSIHVTLPNNNSTITYEVEITNIGHTKYKLTDIIEESYSNNKIKYEIINLDISNIIDQNTTYTFKIKLTTTENSISNQGTLVLKYIFKMYVLTPFYDLIAKDSKALDTNINFAEAPTVTTSGIYEIDNTKNDEYPIYYYRGIVENNNVKFANICWKILRTTKTGGIKLIYNGVPREDGSCHNWGVLSQITAEQFNTNYNTMDDVSYVYSDGSDSKIKSIIDKWYQDNLLNYTNKLEDTDWCNDRTYYINKGSSGAIYTFFYADKRNRTSHNPSTICPENADKFTVNEENGNGKLTYPVGLLTADEATLAGNGNYHEQGAFLYSGQWFWTISPAYYIGNNATVFSVHADGLNPDSLVKSIGGIKPSISLKPNTMVEDGDGSIGNEYIISN